jgi:hypothetical protein
MAVEFSADTFQSLLRTVRALLQCTIGSDVTQLQLEELAEVYFGRGSSSAGDNHLVRSWAQSYHGASSLTHARPHASVPPCQELRLYAFHVCLRALRVNIAHVVKWNIPASGAF